MPSSHLPYREYQARRHQEAVAEARRKEEKTRDPEMEACVIAYHAHRVDGGTLGWDVFKRQWYQAREGRHG